MNSLKNFVKSSINKNANDVDLSLKTYPEFKHSTDQTFGSQKKKDKPKLSVHSLKAYFNGKIALKDINLDIIENQVTALIGPSGCGKTTLLRCINRMHELTPNATAEGQVVLDDMDVYDKRSDPVLVKRRMGMVFQKPNPFPTMSIFDNVASGLKLNGVKDKKLLSDVVYDSLQGAALWEEVKDSLDKPGIGLSGGQQQRLCIARALAMQPEILLMDEPTSALDPIASSKIEDLITDLKKNLTVIIVTHNMQQAARVSDYTAFMYLGELIEYGQTTQIFKNPAKELTERYISGKFG